MTAARTKSPGACAPGLVVFRLSSCRYAPFFCGFPGGLGPLKTSLFLAM
jgi:hypothetical protein